ncbi:MAG: poly-gamma-glutamate hydrolase family protein [Acidimicrobiales bacterium]
MGRFAELLAHDGVEEDLELRSTFGFMAFHGGNLEEGTDRVAASAAEASGASLYAVRQPATLRWHVPSIEVDPTESPALAEFITHVDVAVAIHGYGRAGLWTTLLLGGRNRPLAAHVAGHLRTSIDACYTVVDDLDQIPKDLRGVHRRNPVNACGRGGVQIELPPRIRSRGPFWADLPAGQPIPHTAGLVDALAAAARTWAARLGAEADDAPA